MSPLEQLRESLGDSVVTTPAELERVAYDGMKVAFSAEALILIRERNEVGTVLSLANQHRVPVTVRGAASTLTGAAAPRFGGWVLDLSLLKEFEIDRKNAICRAQAGAVVADIQSAAEAEGLFYPPDPSSKKFCTIGGNIACNAGGMRCVKYGVTRDYVVSLRGFLPTGEAVSWGRDVRKYAVGYNLRDLWIGQEGTLGVVTDATLRLVPKPETTFGLIAAFASEEKALDSITSILAEGHVPAISEFIDTASVSGAEKASGKSFFAGLPGRPLALIQLDGPNELVHRDRKIWEQWASEQAEAYRILESPEEQEEMWEIRRGCSSAMFELGDSKLNEDVTVPLTRQVELMRIVADLRKRFSVAIAVFGHAGDGNLHVNIMYHEANQREKEAAREALGQLLEAVVSIGGVISGEHGIGLAKSPFIRLQLSPVEIETMLRIKKALDPNGILNPGKIFEPFEVWNQPKVKVRLPWDHR